MNSQGKCWISLFSLMISVLVVGCAKSSSDQTPGEIAEDLHALYTSDIEAFSDVDSKVAYVLDYDDFHDRLFSKVFGGVYSGAVQHYYSERIHYAVTTDDLKRVTLNADLPEEGWVHPSRRSDPSTPTPPTNPNVQVGASNLSAGLWLESVVAGIPLTLYLDGQTIPVDSTRTGIMLFGPGYTSAIKDSHGRKHTLPTAYRQAILLHEARHSDCTGGLSSRELSIMKSAASSEDFSKKLPFLRCGHTHILCKSGDFEGLPACDAETFGAYKVGAIYLAALEDAQTNYVDQKIVQMSVLDYESRIEPSAPGFRNDHEPDLSSSGLVD